jgi:metal-responsive CopG/Arc/MetJ family transcriptional regulator
MKIKVSISMEESLFKKLDRIIKKNYFRNKSHFIETATEKFMDEIKNDKNKLRN